MTPRRRLLIVAASALLALAVHASGATGSAAEVNLMDQPFVCKGVVDLDLVRVTISTRLDDAVQLRSGCTGRIGRLEVDTSTYDGIKVLNANANAAHDLVVESGSVICRAVANAYHQDGVHVMGGRDLTFRNMSVDCPYSSSHFFVSTGGAGATTPTRIVCDGCYLGPIAASHTVLISTADLSGVRNSVLCPDRTPFGGPFDVAAGATNVLNDNNSFPTAC